MELTGHADHMYYLYIIIGVLLGLIALSVAAKKGLYLLMKGNYMETAEIKTTFLTKEEFDHECFVKKTACTKNICDKIKELKTGQEAAARNTETIKNQVEKDAATIKTQVEKNQEEVTAKINGVGADIKELRTSMQTELRGISRFMGSVEQYMKEKNARTV